MLQNDNIVTCMPEAIVNYLCRNNSEKRLGIPGSRKMREYRNLTTVDHRSSFSSGAKTGTQVEEIRRRAKVNDYVSTEKLEDESLEAKGRWNTAYR